MIGNIGPLEVILVLAIALIVLGPKKLPEAGRAVGRGIREFKESVSGGDRDEEDEDRGLDAESTRPPAGPRTPPR
jgi:sec-independent protein translocase protein TatA